MSTRRPVQNLKEALGSTGTLLDRLSTLVGDARPEAATARAVLDQRFEDVEAGPNEKAQRDEALAALHFWWADWSEVARRAAHNRSDLIVLGLVKRRTSRAVEVDNTGMEPANDDLVTRHAV